MQKEIAVQAVSAAQVAVHSVTFMGRPGKANQSIALQHCSMAQRFKGY